MIDIKIAMNNGTSFALKSFSCNSVGEWIKRNLMPHGVLLQFFQYDQSTFLNVQSISKISEYFIHHEPTSFPDYDEEQHSGTTEE